MSPFVRWLLAVPAVLLLSAALFPLQAQTIGAVTITVTSSANPSTYAAPLAFTVVVTAPSSVGPVPSGIVSATFGVYPLGTAALDASGRGVITVPAVPSLFYLNLWGLSAGTDTITFTYLGDSRYAQAQSTFTQWIYKANTITAASTVGSAQPLHLSATVTINQSSVATNNFELGSGTSAPSGTVQFFNGTTSLGTATLAQSGLFTSTATLTVAAVPASVSAVYSGDTNFNGSSSSSTGQSGGSAVNLAVKSSANPSVFAEPVTLTISVAPATAGGPTPTGSVSVSLLGLFGFGSVGLDANGQGSLTVPMAPSSLASVPWGLSAGSNSLTLAYSGDSHYASTQTNFTQVVGKADTVITAALGAGSASVTATVSISEPSVSATAFALPGANAATPNPTGSVQFLSNGTLLGTATLSPSGNFQSAATLTANSLVSSTNIVAVYGGDSNYDGSTSVPATLPAQKQVTVAVVSSVNPSTFAATVTFTVTVAPQKQGSLVPTGTVQASLLGSYTLGSAALNAGGTATITVPQAPNMPSSLPWGLATGSNTITFAYSGDANFAQGQTTFNQSVIRADSTTTAVLAPVASSANSATIVATVSITQFSYCCFLIPAGGNLSTSPTGSVDFFDGATLLGSATLTAGGYYKSTATLTIAVVPSSVRAVYYGDSNYNGSSSSVTGNGNGPINITLASSSNPIVYGQAFTILATVTPATAGGPTPSGTVSFFDGSQNLNWTTTLDSNGHGTLPIPVPLPTPQGELVVLGAGSHIITAQYGGDANYAATTSTVSLTQQIAKAPSTTTLSEFTAALSPSQSALVATVADAQPPSGGPNRLMAMSASGLVEGDPTGSVQFYSNGILNALSQLLGTASLTPNTSANVASTAEISTTITGGSLSAAYSGDANFLASSSSVPSATSVSLASSPNPSNTGQSVTLSAKVSSASTTASAPTGSVTFLDGTTTLGSATVSSSGVATLAATFSTAGSHSLAASYSGDANNFPSSSSAYTQVVNSSSGPTDTLTLTASTTTAVFGQRVTLFAQVAGSVTVPPTGTVNFLDGATVVGSGTLAGSTAYAMVTLSTGTHEISAKWVGDTNWPAAQSAVLTLIVNRASTVTTLTGSGTVWTATVAAVRPGTGRPTGTVQLIDTVTQAVVATVNLSAGVGKATLSSVPHTLQAVYSGDSDFEPSSSQFRSSGPGTRR